MNKKRLFALALILVFIISNVTGTFLSTGHVCSEAGTIYAFCAPTNSSSPSPSLSPTPTNASVVLTGLLVRYINITAVDGNCMNVTWAVDDAEGWNGHTVNLKTWVIPTTSNKANSSGLLAAYCMIMSGSGDETSGNRAVCINETSIGAGVNQPTHPFKNEVVTSSTNAAQDYWFWISCFFGAGLNLETFLSEGGTILIAAEVDQMPVQFFGSSTLISPSSTGDYCIYSMQNMTAPSSTPVPSLPSPNLSFYCISSTTTSGFNVQIQGSLTYNGVGLSDAGIQLSDSITGGATWQDLTYVNTDNDGNFTFTWNPPVSGNYAIKATWSGDNNYSNASVVHNFAVASFNNQNQNVFSVTSNSTLTSLVFDSTTNELSFSVSGPSGTTGFTEVCIPQTHIPDISKLNVILNGTAINHNSVSEDSVWLVTFTYHHSTHIVTIALGATPSQKASSSLAQSPSPTSTQVPTNSWVTGGVILGIAVLVIVCGLLLVMWKDINKKA